MVTADIEKLPYYILCTTYRSKAFFVFNVNSHNYLKHFRNVTCNRIETIYFPSVILSYNCTIKFQPFTIQV